MIFSEKEIFLSCKNSRGFPKLAFLFGDKNRELSKFVIKK